MSTDQSPTPAPDLDAVMDAASGFLGLAIEPAWRGTVVANLRVLRAASALVEEFPLPDEVDAAPIFRA